ncbi:hypothetical protein B0H13DRAFT_1924415 [Mycena leptocephala]|nr:hypothetical protein B0H13DRAFT_1924415 [Mycena leptocephala]
MDYVDGCWKAFSDLVWSYDEAGKTKGADTEAFKKHGLDNLLGSVHFSQCFGARGFSQEETRGKPEGERAHSALEPVILAKESCDPGQGSCNLERSLELLREGATNEHEVV